MDSLKHQTQVIIIGFWLFPYYNINKYSGASDLDLWQYECMCQNIL